MATFGLHGASRLIIALALLWLIFIFFIGGPLFHRGESETSVDNSEMIMARLNRASSELRALKIQNEKLKKLIDDLIPQVAAGSSSIQSGGTSSHPQKQYELALRKLYSDIDEMWYAYSKNKFTAGLISDLRNSMKHDLSLIFARDVNWRKSGLQKLEDLVQEKIKRIQNPVDCSTAPKVICDLNKGCGFGCQLHHVMYCMVVALGLNRTMILNSKNWRYVKGRSESPPWNLVFQPITNCIEKDLQGDAVRWDGTFNSKHKLLKLPIIDSLAKATQPEFLPLAIPSQIADKLEVFSSCPAVWFIGQLVRYLMRLSPEMEQFIDDAKYRLNFKSPIVGIHVRRTDKVGTEAAFHSLSEYMVHVDEFYKKLEVSAERRGEKNVKVDRYVYLATDDPGIWRKEVPSFEDKGYYFLGDADVANSAGMGTRYELNSLKNVIMDIWLLSESDHLVCTFSSQVCRIAYELMQTRKANNFTSDWCFAFNSLDDIYYYGGQKPHDMVSVMSHNSASHISLSPGDIIGIAGNHWDGESKGINRNTSKTGLFPSFKAIDKVNKARFQAFDD